MIREQLLPILLQKMENFQALVNDLLEDALNIRPDLFLISLNIDSKMHVSIIIDGDQGVNLTDCIEISRAVEHNIDQELYDFSLDVSSPGAFSDIKLVRQYNKNIGRHLSILKTDDEKLEGLLEAISDNKLLISWETREKKAVGKGKETVKHNKEILISDIKKANVLFK